MGSNSASVKSVRMYMVGCRLPDALVSPATDMSLHSSTSDSSGGSKGGSLKPPFETKLFHFLRKLSEKSGKVCKSGELTGASQLVLLPIRTLPTRT